MKGCYLWWKSLSSFADFIKDLILTFWHSFISVDDLVELLSKSRNGSTLDYELFKKTDQVDSFLRQVNWKSSKSSEGENERTSLNSFSFMHAKKNLSWFFQELNSIYQNATTTDSIFAEILTKNPPAVVFNSTPSSLVTTLSHILVENGSPGC